VRIGSNLDALKSQRSLGQASDRIGQVYQRLSTGQRINRASDDAAGLSIADALTAKSRVFTRGAQNVSDGLSALTIADSAVETLIQLTTRIQELAEQGANGSYSNRQRDALDKEAQSLRDEFLRIVQSTTFNGQRLLDGTVQGLQIQAGY
jgi:flagellin